MLIGADVLGLTILALQVICGIRWLDPNDGDRVVSGTLVYFVLTVAALAFWHHEKLAQRFSDPNQWLALAGGSILLGGFTFCADIFIGTVFHSGSHSALDAASKAGGPFGFGLTLMICPGLTSVAIAGLVRSLLEPR